MDSVTMVKFGVGLRLCHVCICQHKRLTSICLNMHYQLSPTKENKVSR